MYAACERLAVLVVAMVLAVTVSATQYQTREVKSFGAISGKVLLGNAKAESETIPITKDNHS